MSEVTNTQQATVVVDGVDISKLTSEELAKLSKEEWNEFETVFKAVAKARAEAALAKVKAKLTPIRDYILPVVKYGMGLAILLRVFGII
jgi:hypothetical protein